MEPGDHLRDESDQPVQPPTWPAGWHVRHVAETGSTNADLLSDPTAPHRTALVSDHQTAGRGRLDRRWDAPPSANLLVSLLFRDVPTIPGDLMRGVGVAAVEAARGLGAPDALLKWPNDVIVGDRKLAGLLAERGRDGEIVVGLGLNVGWAPDGATRLGDHVSPLEVLAAVLTAYDRLPHDLHERYRSLLGTLGRRVRVEMPDDEFTGVAIEVERDGRLVVVDDCAASHRVDVGDVVHVRPA
jgi:BirA family biotin operon repressor/biotin-[acetyl-CoA-carboxylase] ligase